MATNPHIAVIGGGPAGLRAAESCAAGGARVSVFEAKRSAARKLLVAGYGGLNLTHGEPLEDFVTRYVGPNLPAEHFARMIRAFSPDDLRQWAGQLGIATFEQRTGRVYPKEMKAAPLVRHWLKRLRAQEVEFHVNHRLQSLQPSHGGIELQFENEFSKVFDAVILALGGASWAKTGSDGTWPPLLEAHEIRINSWEPANCGWELHWPREIVKCIEGKPLKNLRVSAGPVSILGELMPTRYGLEGGAIYQLGPLLR
ncbi:MAG: NAD(P)/FAD-dependent oxidoreductase, partial [Verrucomicrobiales bacterium]